MKRLNKLAAFALSLLTVFSATGCSFDEKPNHGDGSNSQISDTTIDLVKDGKSDYKILLSAQATETEKYASGELVSFFQQATGITLPVVTDDTQVDKNGKYLSIGDTALFEQSGMKVPVSEVGDDGFKIQTYGNSVVMNGAKEGGKLYSVDDFMEEQGLDRIIVDFYADWNANEDGEFGKSSWDGFQYSTIYVPSDTRITINLNGHKINRGLGDNNEYDGEVIFVNDDADLIINGGKSGDPIVKSGENPDNVPMGVITGGNSDNGAGGIHIDDGARVTLNNVNLIGNAVDDDDGSAIAAYDGAVLTMNGGSISNNTLWRSHNANVTPYGGVYVNDSTAYFNNVEFADNIFRGYDHSYGVALYVRSSDVTLENCTFKHNGYRHTANNIWTPQSVISIDE